MLCLQYLLQAPAQLQTTSLLRAVLESHSIGCFLHLSREFVKLALSAKGAVSFVLLQSTCANNVDAVLQNGSVKPIT